MKKQYQFQVLSGAAAVWLFAAVSSHAAAVASWTFDEGAVGDQITASVDSVSGLQAVPSKRNAGQIKYVAGKEAGSAAGLGSESILQVMDKDGLLGSGFTNLTISFDIDLTDDISATSVVLRNGHASVPFNIYLQEDNVIGVELQSADGKVSGAVKTSGPALSARAGWQSVSIVWDGDAVSIAVDGKPCRLSGGGTSRKVKVGPLQSADAPLGIGGIVRSNGSIGQFLNASIDNIVIGN